MGFGALGVAGTYVILGMFAGAFMVSTFGTWGAPLQAGVSYVAADALGVIDWAQKLVK